MLLVDGQGSRGVTACSLLTDKARASVTGTTDVTCADAILNIDETDTEVSSTQVWGDAAQVKIGTDVIFLRLQRAGWRVRAAGCETQADGVYDCDVEG